MNEAEKVLTKEIEHITDQIEILEAQKKNFEMLLEEFQKLDLK